jgi:precorrin-6Y C5,15-methyltransferase (decarboxylating)
MGGIVMGRQGHLAVISCGIGHNSLNPAMINIVSKACVIAGSKRLTDMFDNFQGEVVILGSNLKKSAKDLIKRSKTENVVVLAPGDALFYDIGSIFADMMNPQELTIIPNITAMQSFLSKLKIPFNETSFFSLRGTNNILPYRDILSRKSAVIYCDNKLTASDVVRELIKECNVGERMGAIAEDLGTENEKITTGYLNSLSGESSSLLSMLYIYPPGEKDPIFDRGIVLGVENDSFDYDNDLITSSEVRAIALSKLKLGSGVMWDIRAGSGSVGIEAASLCPDLTVYAVENDPKNIKNIKENIRDFGRTNVEVVHEEALHVIDSLPVPRSVFIGGTEKNIRQIICKSYEKLRLGGRLVVSVETPETRLEVQKVEKCTLLNVTTVSIAKTNDLKSNTDEVND